jgi:hypothetical protein
LHRGDNRNTRPRAYIASLTATPIDFAELDRLCVLKRVSSQTGSRSGQFVPDHNTTFGRAPRDPANAFVPLGAVDLDVILCHEEPRVVARDNTVTIGGRVLQIAAQPGRRSCVGLTVVVRQHLDGRHTITRIHGPSADDRKFAG